MVGIAIEMFGVDFHRKDLQEAIENGAYPKWKFAVQILEEDKEHSFDFECVAKYLLLQMYAH
jgi:catalase